MTGYLTTLGAMMGTGPANGTDGNFPTAVQAWLDASYPGVFATAANYADENHVPTIHDVAPLVLQQGSIANVIMGWYHWNDAYAIYERDGGHSVTLAGVDSDKEALQ